MRQRQGDSGFTNASGPDDRYETLFFQPCSELPNGIIASNHLQGPPRQMQSSHRCLSGGRLGHRPGHCASKAVATARDVGKVADGGVPVIESFAKAGDLSTDTALIDDQLPPGATVEVMFADNFRRLLEQGDQDVEGTAANLHRNAVLFEQSFGHMQAKGTKRSDFPPQRGQADRGGIVLFLGTWRSGDRGSVGGSALLTLSTWMARFHFRASRVMSAKAAIFGSCGPIGCPESATF